MQRCTFVMKDIRRVVGNNVVRSLQHRIRQNSNCFIYFSRPDSRVCFYYIRSVQRWPCFRKRFSCFGNAKPSDHCGKSKNCSTTTLNHNFGCTTAKNCLKRTRIRERIRSLLQSLNHHTYQHTSHCVSEDSSISCIFSDY